MSEALLNRIRELVDSEFRPSAEAADQGSIHGQVETNIRKLADLGCFGFNIPVSFGGLAADDETRREYSELIASSCGVTSFVQQQLHGGGGFVGASNSPSLKASLLPQLATGRLLCGIAFSHLRRQGSPPVTATRVSEGFVFNGKVPWITGWALLDSFILGAVADDSGDHVYVYVDKVLHGSGLKALPPEPLACMNASDTVEVEINNLFISNDHLIYERPSRAIHRSDYCGIAGNITPQLGCTRGSVIQLHKLAEQPGKQNINEIADRFEQSIKDCRSGSLRWNGATVDHPDYKTEALKVRSRATVLAVRAGHAVVTATGGSAQRLNNPGQRLLREAMFYTTVAQTEDVRWATLQELANISEQ